MPELNLQSGKIPEVSTSSVVNYSFSDILCGSISGHSVIRLVVGALAWPTLLISNELKGNLRFFDYSSLFWGSLQGIIANVAHEKLVQKTAYFKEHKIISLITAGLISSALTTLPPIWENFCRDPKPVDEKILVLAMYISFCAPIGSVIAYGGQELHESFHGLRESFQAIRKCVQEIKKIEDGKIEKGED